VQTVIWRTAAVLAFPIIASTMASFLKAFGSLVNPNAKPSLKIDRKQESKGQNAISAALTTTQTVQGSGSQDVKEATIVKQSASKLTIDPFKLTTAKPGAKSAATVQASKSSNVPEQTSTASSQAGQPPSDRSRKQSRQLVEDFCAVSQTIFNHSYAVKVLFSISC
jgi:hypothetical protein